MTIHDYTEQAVRKYLRTVLLVDDRLFVSESGTVPEQTSVQSLGLVGAPDTSASSVSNSGREPRSPGQSQAGSGHPSGEGSSQSIDSFSAQAVIDGFSQLGIVCGLYQPNTSEFSDGSIPQKLIDLCNHSDVFILDWKLKSGQADSPVPALLSKLIKGDESIGAPMAIRFCAIYTDQFLNTVFAELRTAIKEGFPEKSVVEEIAKFRIRVDGITIRLYRKNDLPEADGTPTRFVSSHDLAEKIEKDFVSEYEGIMSATALMGIAEVRDNAKRILDKFPREMDPALVLHAGLTMHDVDISKDITSLLSDEATAILVDKQIPSDDIYELCKEYVERECQGDFLSSIKDTPNLVPQDVSSDDIRSFFIQVFNDKKLPKKTKVFEPCKKKLQLHRMDVNLLAALANLVRKKITPGAVYRFGALAALFCQRTNYGDIRLLRFGTIVSTRRDREGVSSVEYYLCLMPTCDSKRLPETNKKTGEKEKHGFPFWRLEKVSSDHQGRSHGVVILDGEEYSPYCIKGKIRQNFALYEFYSEGGVVKFDESSCVKTCDGNAQFTWVAELKSAHSQRMAEYVSREFSRVGLIESEWLRLQVDR